MEIVSTELSKKTGLAQSTIRMWLSTQEKYRIIGIEKPLKYDIPNDILLDFVILFDDKKRIKNDVRYKIQSFMLDLQSY